MAYLFVAGAVFLIGFLLVRTIKPLLHERQARAVRAAAVRRTACRACRAGDAHLFWFRTCRCFGIAPIAAVWEVTRHEHILCSDCARREAIAACKKIGCFGGWGFPGILVAPLFTGVNTCELIRNRSASIGTVARCAFWGILIPWLLLVLFLTLLILIIGLIMGLVDHFN